MDTTHVIVWIVIILVAILLIWLLRKWIKRLIFIIVVLGLAFFIFGLFNPSGASRLWYNIKTLPDRVVSRFSDKSFLDYDGYLSTKEDEPGDKLDFNLDNNGDSDSNVAKDSQADDTEKEKTVDDKVEEEKITQSGQSFSSSLTNISLPVISEIEIKDSKVSQVSDEKIMKALEEYLGKNVTDDSDVLVTVQYSEDGGTPDKIVLQAQEKSHFAALNKISRKSGLSLFHGIRKDEFSSDSGTVIETVAEPVVQESSKKTTKATTNYNGLTQKEIKETEELFSILFD